MSSIQPAPTARHCRRSTVLSVLAVVVALVGILGCRSPAGASAVQPPGVASPASPPAHERLPELPGAPQVSTGGVLGVVDGHVADGVTVFDDTYPAVANLDPDLLGALRRAAADAGADGVDVYVNSGWRSPAYQEQLLEQAVSTYGSRAAAARWVATPATSPHVSGDAVDIQESDATVWLSEYGAEYGLCQIFRNEPWHYELRPDAVDHGCPAQYTDPTHDPRMQR